MTKHQLAAKVLAHWEKDVRPFAPDEHLRWQELLHQLPDDLSPEQYRDALLPIAAKNDKEQTVFVALFELAKGELIEALPPPGETEKEAEKTLVRPSPLKKNLRWFFLLAALAVLYAIFKICWPAPTQQYPRLEAPTARPNTQNRVCLDSVLGAHTALNSRITFEVNQDTTLRTPLGVYVIEEKNGCIRFTSGDSTGRDSIRLNVSDTDGQSAVDLIQSVQVLEDSIGVGTGGTDYDRFFTHDPPFDHDSLFEALELKPPNTFTTTLYEWSNWIKAAILCLLAVLLAVWVYWRARKRQKLVVQREKPTKPPYVWNIRIPNLLPPDPGESFGLTLNALRRRTDDDTRVLDMPQTVRATIRRGGMVEFRFRQLTRPPEYLLLIDRQNTLDHRARLYDDLYRILLQNEVLAERFFYDGDLRLCYNDQHPEGFSLDELLFRYPAHRLLIIGSGRQMFNTATGKLAKWTAQFARWKERALLSPLAAAEWGRRERSLTELFRFAPASIEGMRKLIEAFDADEDQRLPRLDKLAALALGEPVLLEDGDLRQTLEKHYPDPLTRTWIAACAIWPELHYDLTLWLGHWLAQESGQPVATMARFGELLRLPWFANGEIPDAARAVLLDELHRTNPALENRLRMALHALLEANAPPAESAAWDDFAMRVAFNEWQFTTDPKIKKEREKQIADWITRNGNPDFITIRALKGKPGPLDSLLPDSWKKILYKGKLPGLGVQEWLKDTLRIALPIWVLAAAGLLWGWQPKAPDDCVNGEQLELSWKGELRRFCAETPDERAILGEYSVRQALQTDTLPPEPDTLHFGEATQLRQECEANIANALYNKGIPFYNTHDSLRLLRPRLDPNASVWKKRACQWFEAAAAADTSLQWVRAASDWCAEKTTTEPPTNPCRQIAAGVIEVGFRNRAHSLSELDEIAKNPNGKLAKSTLIGVIKPGQQVELLGEETHVWKVRFQGKEGFVAKSVFQRATLVPCGPAPNNQTAPSFATATVGKMMPVKGGSFTMGCTAEQGEDCDDDEKPAHQVRVADFEIGVTEVTNEQYAAFLNEKGNQKEGGVEWINLEGSYQTEKCRIQSSNGRVFTVESGYEKHPVIYVSWYGVKAYCAWLSTKGSGKFRLPTEAEWEFAARGGNKTKGTKYAGSNNLDEVGWYTENTKGTGTRQVAGKIANELGLFDMSGNVWEWCEDDWHDNYEKAPDDGRAWVDSGGRGSSRVLRGGSWIYGARNCRVSIRGIDSPGGRGNLVGFRLASSPQ